jgi:hypothetical protein
LDPAKRITVKAWHEDALRRNFGIGKAASSFRHTFVKLDDDSRVFHAADNFRGKFEQTSESLRDRGVLSFKASDIQKVQITIDQISMDLVRAEVPVKPAVSQPEKSDATPPAAVKYEWQDPDGKKVNDQNLNRLLTTLGNLKCTQYIDDLNKDSFSDPIYALKLSGAQDYQLHIFAKLEKDAENYPAVSSGSDYPFLLANSQAQQILKDSEEMLIRPQADEKTAEEPKSE